MGIKIKKEQILSFLITLTTICANEILKIFVKNDLISAVSFGIMAFIMLIVYIKRGEEE